MISGTHRRVYTYTANIKRLCTSMVEVATTNPRRGFYLPLKRNLHGSWLHTLPVTSLGLRMDDNTIRIAIGLRLGTPLCIPHLCYHCGANVDTLGTHGLSCRFLVLVVTSAMPCLMTFCTGLYRLPMFLLG